MSQRVFPKARDTRRRRGRRPKMRPLAPPHPRYEGEDRGDIEIQEDMFGRDAPREEEDYDLPSRPPPGWEGLGASLDTRRAMRQAPDYWLKWYTAKSVGLGVAVGIIGYLIGRGSRG